MNRAFKCLVVILSFLLISSCSSIDKQSYFGTYTFEEVTYLSGLSSSTIEYLNGKMAGTKYTIEEDLFKLESKDNTVEISSPKYVKDEIHKKVQENTIILNDVHTLKGEEIKYKYNIYDKDGNKTHMRLYISSDSLWIASYADNTGNGSDIIMSIYKLS